MLHKRRPIVSFSRYVTHCGHLITCSITLDTNSLSLSLSLSLFDRNSKTILLPVESEMLQSRKTFLKASHCVRVCIYCDNVTGIIRWSLSLSLSLCISRSALFHFHPQSQSLSLMMMMMLISYCGHVLLINGGETHLSSSGNSICGFVWHKM